MPSLSINCNTTCAIMDIQLELPPSLLDNAMLTSEKIVSYLYDDYKLAFLPSLVR